jgi:hypothetical protein
MRVPVLRALSLCTCCRHYPGTATGGTASLIRPVMSAFPEMAVGSACALSFSRLAQRSLALRPAHSRCHRFVARLPEGFRHIVTSMPAPVASGWSGCRVGLAPTGKRRRCTAHAISGHSRRAGLEQVSWLGWPSCSSACSRSTWSTAAVADSRNARFRHRACHSRVCPRELRERQAIVRRGANSLPAGRPTHCGRPCDVPAAERPPAATFQGGLRAAIRSMRRTATRVPDRSRTQSHHHGCRPTAPRRPPTGARRRTRTRRSSAARAVPPS